MRRSSLVPALALVALATLPGLAAAQPADPSAVPPVPSSPDGFGVAIALDNGVGEAEPGDRLDYRVTLRNTDADAPATVDVELTLPVGATVVDVRDGGAAPEPWFAAWTLDVPPGGETTVSATFTAGRPRSDAVDVKGHAATACLVRDHARLVCASDIDQLPGAPDIAAIGEPEPPRPGWVRPVVVGLALLVGVAVVLALRSAARRARRRPARSASSPARRPPPPDPRHATDGSPPRAAASEPVATDVPGTSATETTAEIEPVTDREPEPGPAPQPPTADPPPSTPSADQSPAVDPDPDPVARPDADTDSRPTSRHGSVVELRPDRARAAEIDPLTAPLDQVIVTAGRHD